MPAQLPAQPWPRAMALYTWRGWMAASILRAPSSRTDIWLAVSTDGGTSFGPNVRVNPTEGGYNGQPALVDDTDGPAARGLGCGCGTGDQVLYYSSSDDGGLTFAEPRLVVSDADGLGRGRPRGATLAVSPDGRLYLGWIDALGVHLTML